MFTIEQIIEAHSKVKSGADFPEYIKNLKSLGVMHYTTFVSDGHTVYYGIEDYKITSAEKHHPITITEVPNKEQFQVDLKSHQNGKTDYLTFCKDAAESGVEKWSVCLEEMTCIYFDKMGNKIQTEKIPV
ncbi:MAG TPA: DUF1398 family protein [Flavobacterium sp.]|nr:DUF1398 family protein [Flavobacterium sp.]